MPGESNSAGLLPLQGIELVEKTPLTFSQISRQLDIDEDNEISGTIATHMGSPLAPDADFISRLSPGRQVHNHLIIDNIKRNSMSENGLCVRDPHSDIQIIAVSLEPLIRFNRNEHIQIPGLTASLGVLTLARQPQAHSGIHPGRYHRAHLFSERRPARALTILAWGGNPDPFSVTGGTGCRERHESSALDHLPMPATSHTCLRGRSGCRAGAVAGPTASKMLKFNLFFSPSHRLGKGQFEIISKIGPPRRPGRSICSLPVTGRSTGGS